MKNTFVIFVLCLFAQTMRAQDPCGDWKLANEKGNMKVYVRECSDSPIKEFKINDRFMGNFATLIKIMDDPNTIKLLSERCVEARELKQISPNELLQYYLFNMPPGVTDRDVISKLTVWRSPNQYKTLTESVSDNSIVPLPKGVIRLKKVKTSFYFEKQKDGTIFMEYTGRTDPNGWIPAWLVNFLATREAQKIVEKLKALIE
jgi:hypothetical protein